MLHKISCLGRITVIRRFFIQDGVIPGFFDVCCGTCNQPERIIVETASDIRITFLGQRLILMICTSVFKLCCCNIQNTLSCAVRNQMYETKQILTGITESHASSDTGFEVGSRTAHIKCDHTLILMPDVYHTIQFFLGRGYRKVGKQFIPVFFQFSQCCF